MASGLWAVPAQGSDSTDRFLAFVHAALVVQAEQAGIERDAMEARAEQAAAEALDKSLQMSEATQRLMHQVRADEAQRPAFQESADQRTVFELRSFAFDMRSKRVLCGP